MSNALQAWFNHNAATQGMPEPCRMGARRPSDTIDFPDLLVTEEPADPDTLRRFYTAEERKALELLP